MGKSSGARLQSLAVLILNPCGNAPSRAAIRTLIGYPSRRSDRSCYKDEMRGHRTAIVRQAGVSDFVRCCASGSGQRGAEAAGGHAQLPAKDRGQMALVGEPGFLRNQSEGLVGPAQQGFGAFEPTLDDVALRPNPGRLLEGAAEVIGAQTGDVGQHGEREVVIEMRLYEVPHAPQPFRRKALGAGRQREMREETPSDADAQGRTPGFRSRIWSAKPPSISWAKLVTIWLSKGSCMPMQMFKPGC